VKNYVEKYRVKASVFKEHIAGKLEAAKKGLDDLNKVSLTDPESRFMKAKKSTIRLSYNSRITVDKNGVILASDVC